MLLGLPLLLRGYGSLNRPLLWTAGSYSLLNEDKTLPCQSHRVAVILREDPGCLKVWGAMQHAC